MTGSRPSAFRRVAKDGEAADITRALAIEAPIAIEFNGIGYAVMMATPADLTDFAYGFASSERLIAEVGDIVSVDHHRAEAGDILRVTLASARSDILLERVRHRVSESSCGLCGIENLEQALRPLPRVTATVAADDAAIFRALAALDGHQMLNRATSAVHAAAQCSADGEIITVREDVGRHNAFDKLIGAMLRAGARWDGGFALLSSRCSYELVEKAALASCPMLATISAPTTLAVECAREANIRLVALARPDAMLVATA
ncbi:formate dehydrogenase accessory sulfurtransferase FdhD [Sphingomonas gilva]|uniref:Sulfur carrier protein FdhD n=1 Tax=Sphingomonas gilva TaxID=2305907 RepID=A0A396RMM7_9SPHN|nr:formate dehydrogenase accessory sulfurtransferase FdhD [Sphingomonas gilva]RHW17559.1 formate dehydrogenase accessory sulfurtransferase FdhD [Sphingomonas gilva]